MSCSEKVVAARCAQLIRDYWEGRGFKVNVDIVPASQYFTNGAQAETLHLVRSDMINGLPRRGPVRRGGSV